LTDDLLDHLAAEASGFELERLTALARRKVAIAEQMAFFSLDYDSSNYDGREPFVGDYQVARAWVDVRVNPRYL
jgi:hypothetical protein